MRDDVLVYLTLSGLESKGKVLELLQSKPPEDPIFGEILVYLLFRRSVWRHKTLNALLVVGLSLGTFVLSKITNIL